MSLSLLLELYVHQSTLIVVRSDILDPRFWEENDLRITDIGFTIADDLKALNIELNILAFLFVGISLQKQR